MILVIDNFDSFTYNLVQYLALCGAEVQVRRNDAITLDEVKHFGFAGIMLSPGPCTPRESGVCLDIARAALSDQLGGLPLFGVCLGHQAIGFVSGSTVDRAPTIRHGKTSVLEHTGQGIFQDIPSPFKAVRYHSLTILDDTLADEFEVTARATDDDAIMGIRHRHLPIEGVQFHPESVLTEHGMKLVQNFVNQTQR